MRAILALVSLTLLSGCALPALPALPKLPKLPSAQDVLPVSTSGQSLKQAQAQAMPLAEAWASNADWVSLQGLKLDPGGRNGGHAEGVWIFTFQAPGKTQALEVRVTAEQAVKRDISPKIYTEPALPKDLSALLDSTEAVNKAGISARSLTMVLRNDTAGPLYNIVEEGGAARAAIDAKTGAVRPE